MLLQSRIIDIYHGDEINLQDAKTNGLLAVLHKSTEGLDFIDNKFFSRKQAALAAGLLWGSYHFGTDADGKDQATYFLNRSGHGGLLALDFENNSQRSMTVEQAEDFVSEVFVQTGNYPLIYVDPSHAKLLVNRSKLISHNCPLWIANWRVAAPVPENYWPTDWRLWQYDSQGIDLNRFNGTYEELAVWWKQQIV